MGILVKTRKVLWGKSGNRCNFPDCRKELCLKEDFEEHLILGEECHIVAKSKKGPRGKSDLSKAERDQYDNLILLCDEHHKKIDKNVEKYTVKKLHAIKNDHEKWVSKKLNEYDEIDFDFMKEVIFDQEYLKEVCDWLLEYEDIEIDDVDIEKSLNELSYLNEKTRKLLVLLIKYNQKKDEIDIQSILTKVVNDEIYEEGEFFNGIRLLDKHNFIDFDENFEVCEDEFGNAHILQGDSIYKYLLKSCWLGDLGFVIDGIRLYLGNDKKFKKLIVKLEYEIL